MEILIDGKNAFNCNSVELHEAFELLRQASTRLRQKAALRFYPGQFVSFESRKGRKVIGKILKVNKTSISLVEVDEKTAIELNGKWRVSANLLTLLS